MVPPMDGPPIHWLIIHGILVIDGHFGGIHHCHFKTHSAMVGAYSAMVGVLASQGLCLPPMKWTTSGFSRRRTADLQWSASWFSRLSGSSWNVRWVYCSIRTLKRLLNVIHILFRYGIRISMISRSNYIDHTYLILSPLIVHYTVNDIIRTYPLYTPSLFTN